MPDVGFDRDLLRLKAPRGVRAVSSRTQRRGARRDRLDEGVDQDLFRGRSGSDHPIGFGHVSQNLPEDPVRLTPGTDGHRGDLRSREPWTINSGLEPALIVGCEPVAKGASPLTIATLVSRSGILYAQAAVYGPPAETPTTANRSIPR